MMCERRPRGFTLLELIIVIGLMSAVTTMGAVMFSKMTDLWRGAVRDAEIDATARYVMDQVRQDVGCVLSPALSGVSVRGVSATVAGNSRRLADDQVMLPVQLLTGPNGPATTAEVRYAVERASETGGALKLYSGPIGQQAPVGGPTMVAENVTQFKVEYLARTGSGQWMAEWNQATLPAAIRVSVAIADPARPGASISRKAVFRIPVSG